MDHYNEFMSKYKTPQELRERLRAYLIFRRCPLLFAWCGGRADARCRHGGVVVLFIWCLGVVSPAVLTSSPPRLTVSCLVPFPPGAVRELRRELGYRALLQELSPELRGMLTLHCYGPAVTSVPFFRVSIKHLSHRESMDASAESNGFLQNVSRTPCAECGV